MRSSGAATGGEAWNRARQRVAEVLNQYPDVSSADRQEVAAFIKAGPAADVAMLETDECLQLQLAAFRRDHQDQFRSALNPERLIIWFSAVVAFGAGIWLLSAPAAA